MKKKVIIATIVCALVVSCLIVHRRVILAMIKGEPMPKAPAWHFWVKKENRRG